MMEVSWRRTKAHGNRTNVLVVVYLVLTDRLLHEGKVKDIAEIHKRISAISEPAFTATTSVSKCSHDSLFLS